MSQQVNLEELTRLYELSQTETHVMYRPHGVAFNVALLEAFPALRDELVTARKNNKDLIQDSCDAQEAAIECAKSFGVCIDNGPGYGQPNIFQLLEDIQDAGDTMRDELVRLREEREQWRMSSVCREYKRQLDEAKGLLEWGWTVIANAGVSLGDWESLHKDWPPVARDWEQKIHVFLASLAGREDDVVVFDRDGSRTRVAHQAQPTQGEECHSCKGEGVEYINAGDGLGDAIDCSKCKSAASKARYFYCAEFGTTWKITSNGEAFSKRKVHREEFIGPCVLGSVDLSVEGFLESDGWQEITAEEAGDAPPQEVEKELPPCCDFCAKPETDCSCIDDAERQEVEGGEGS